LQSDGKRRSPGKSESHWQANQWLSDNRRKINMNSLTDESGNGQAVARKRSVRQRVPGAPVVNQDRKKVTTIVRPEVSTRRVNLFDYQRGIRESSLSREHKLTALIMSTYANGDGLSVCPGLENLERTIGKTRKTISGYIKTLVLNGYLIQVTSGKGGRSTHASLYNLSLPARIEAPIARQDELLEVNGYSRLPIESNYTLPEDDSSMGNPEGSMGNQDYPTPTQVPTQVVYKQPRVTTQDPNPKPQSRSGRPVRDNSRDIPSPGSATRSPGSPAKREGSSVQGFARPIPIPRNWGLPVQDVPARFKRTVPAIEEDYPDEIVSVSMGSDPQDFVETYRKATDLSVADMFRTYFFWKSPDGIPRVFQMKKLTMNPPKSARRVTLTDDEELDYLCRFGMDKSDNSRRFEYLCGIFSQAA
jgi:biotin operon repressor